MITVYINIYVPYFDFLPLYLPCISYYHSCSYPPFRSQPPGLGRRGWCRSLSEGFDPRDPGESWEKDLAFIVKISWNHQKIMDLIEILILQ